MRHFLGKYQKGFCCHISHRLINVEHPSTAVCKNWRFSLPSAWNQNPVSTVMFSYQQLTFIPSKSLNTGLASSNPLKTWELTQKVAGRQLIKIITTWVIITPVLTNDGSMEGAKQSTGSDVTHGTDLDQRLALKYLQLSAWKRHLTGDRCSITIQYNTIQYSTVQYNICLTPKVALISIKMHTQKPMLTKRYRQWRNWGRGHRGSYPRAQQTRGAKQPHQKYFNDHKSVFDEVCWMSQQ